MIALKRVRRKTGYTHLLLHGALVLPKLWNSLRSPWVTWLCLNYKAEGCCLDWHRPPCHLMADLGGWLGTLYELVKSNLSGHEESLLLLSPAGNSCSFSSLTQKLTAHTASPIWNRSSLFFSAFAGSRHMSSYCIPAERWQHITLLQQKQEHL